MAVMRLCPVGEARVPLFRALLAERIAVPLRKSGAI